MGFVETLFKNVRMYEENGRVIVSHDINQFVWYRDGQAYAKGRDNMENLVSAVKFELPHYIKQLPPKLLVVGNGIDFCDVYFYKLGTPHLKLDKPSRMWRLFSYKGSLREPELKWRDKPEHTIDFTNVFTTSLDPFLYGIDEYPDNCIKMYDFQLGGLDRLQVIADKYEINRLRIVYVPDKKYSSPNKIIELEESYEEGLHSETLDEMAGTDNFRHK